MIRIVELAVQGVSDLGRFRGVLSLHRGLQVITARNGFGKSTAITALYWCWGLEPMLGLSNNDASCFPEAAREVFKVENGGSARVQSSAASVLIEHRDGRRLRLTRPIVGDKEIVEVDEMNVDGSVRSSKLMARHDTMADEHGGLQRFLFTWAGLPILEVSTFRGTPSSIYLENLAAALIVEQREGWTEIQARQISRYAQQQIAEIVVEYLLGAVDAVRSRVATQVRAAKETALRDRARAVAERVNNAVTKFGWTINWSGNGSVADVLARWLSKTIKESLVREAEVNLVTQRDVLQWRIDALKRRLTSEPIDPNDRQAPTGASQRFVELKDERNGLNAELRAARQQRANASELLASIESRMAAAQDLLRFKETGVGRLDHVECPTCHRELDHTTFHLVDQSPAMVGAHVEALRRDRNLMRDNLESLDDQRLALRARLSVVESELADAQNALATITMAIGSSREQLAKTAADLSAAERQMERFFSFVADIDQLQSEIDLWMDEAKALQAGGVLSLELPERLAAFTVALRDHLVALGHSEVSEENKTQVSISDQYVPLLNGRKLRFLGSASDPSRLVAAYSLALASASVTVHGLHPGIVVLDEPLQQNPDDPHRELFLEFLDQQLAKQDDFQTVIVTYLRGHELDQAEATGVRIIKPESRYFLQLVPPELSNGEPTDASAGLPPTNGDSELSSS